MLATGRWGFLEHLKGSSDPEMLFRAVPGVGPALARRICRTLRIHTLEELEVAAHDGRLARVPGFGHRRAAALRAVLANMLGRIRRPAIAGSEEPPVEVLLDVDREYRERASAGGLIRIAPKRFNREGEAWLPLLHSVRGAWHFTALYSNTARAHQLRRIADWVVIYFHKDGHPEGQRTVVTETRGAAAAKRIVRGREAECRQYYASLSAPAAPPRFCASKFALATFDACGERNAVGFYGLLKLEVMGTRRFGRDFVDWLLRNKNPLKILFRVAAGQAVKIAISGISDIPGPATLMGLVITTEGGTPTSIEREYITAPFNNSILVPTFFALD